MPHPLVAVPTLGVLAEAETAMVEENQSEPEAEETESAAAEADDEAGTANDITEPTRVKAITEVWVETTAILGTTHIPVSQLLKVGRGAVIELDSGVNDPIEITANDVLIARGDVVIVDDKIAVQVNEMVKRESG